VVLSVVTMSVSQVAVGAVEWGAVPVIPYTVRHA